MSGNSSHKPCLSRRPPLVEIINLNRERKAREKKAAKSKAIENRLVFGRSRADKASIKQQLEREARNLDGSKLSED
jgi:hypothetical protein